MANLTIRIDNNDKQEFARICEKIGLSVSTAFNVFVKSVIREEKIPFELSAKEQDGFYSEANIRHLEELKRLDDEGKLKFVVKTMDELRAMEKWVRLFFFELAWEQYQYWQKQDKKFIKKLNKLLTDIDRNGNDGIGHPEPLKGNLSGW